MIWDYHTLDWRAANPGAKLRGNMQLPHPRRCRQDGRTLTVLIDGDDPFRAEVCESDLRLVFQEIEACPGLRFWIDTRHIHAAKFFIRKRSKAEVDHAHRWMRTLKQESRESEVAKEAIARAQRPYLPNLTIVFQQFIKAEHCAIRMGGDPEIVVEPVS